MKKYCLSLIVVLFTLLMVSCSQYRTPLVVIAVAETNLERWERDVNYLEDFFKLQDCRVIVADAENSYDKQVSQLRGFIDQGASVIILIPVQSKGYRDIVDYAREKGTRIIAYDRLVEDADIDFYTTFDNLQVGVNQANYLINNSRARDFVLINGPERDNNSIMLRRGQLSVLNSYRLRHRVNVLVDVIVNEYSEEAGYDAFVKILQQGDAPHAVIAGNDALARGVIRAIDENGNLGRIDVVGQDADRESLAYIKEGKQLMTVYKPIKRLTGIAGEVVVSYLEGLSPDEYDLSSTYNGFKNVSTIILGTIIVDKTNMKETVIRDGFFSETEL